MYGKIEPKAEAGGKNTGSRVLEMLCHDQVPYNYNSYVALFSHTFEAEVYAVGLNPTRVFDHKYALFVL